MSPAATWTAFPGGTLIETGLQDLARAVESIPALLVSIGAMRLREAGMDVPTEFDDPEHRLYEHLAREDADAAHGRYNALIRQLVSFERAVECAS